MKISKSLIGLNLHQQLEGENLPEAAPALRPGPGSAAAGGHVPYTALAPPGTAVRTRR